MNAIQQAIQRAILTAISFQRRFNETGNADDIAQVVFHCENALSFGLDLPPFAYSFFGNAYLSRFTCLGKVQDLEHAISHHQKAVQSTPSGDAELPGRLNNLGSSYLRRFEATGDDLQDTEHALSYYQKGLKSTPSGHPDILSFLSNLGNLYSCRSVRTGDLQDFEQAISYHQKVVESAPSGHADVPLWFYHLGTSYSRRFQRFGNLQDIDHAISYHQKAVECAPSGRTELSSWFSSLGNSHLQRWERTRDIQDIDDAVSHLQKAIQSTPSGTYLAGPEFNNLGNAYAIRFNYTLDLEDIDHAISLQQKAVQSTPSGHAELPGLLDNLGTSYSRRFYCSESLQDIDHAISYHQKAIQSTPSGHTRLPAGFNHLGISYTHRFKCTRDLQDIDRAISYHQKAVESTPSDHADLPGRFSNLGSSYLDRFNSTNYLPDVQNSIASYRQAAEANGAPSIRLKAAKEAAMLSSDHDPSQCLTDFALAISLLSEVAGLEQTINRRHANLRGYSDLVGSAVATALRFDSTNRALEWLEQGRCLVWNQLNQLRTPIDNLRMKNPSLANRFIEIARALESHGTRSALSLPSLHPTLVEAIRLQDDTLNHTIHATEYKQLLEEIRALPDFHDFLQPPKATDILSSLPNDGPLVIFNIHKTRCDALAVIAGIEEPLHIPLENFSLVQAEELQEILRFDLLKQREVEDQDRMPRRVRPNPSSMLFVLNELWRKVVQPILEALGYSLNPSDCGRIWWCPTGPLAFLPLHAAGIYGAAHNPGSCVSDFVVSSYTPTFRTLNDRSTASSTSSKCTSILLISQPNTPGLSSIPLTRKETHDLETLMKRTAIEALLLEDSKATVENVKAEMKSRSWVHFACHGVQDVHQPLSSGLCLHDGRLELLEIMKQKIPNLDLVFLSACQTSKGDLKLSEEVVHLAAGMLGAGCRGVVGTMWSISDLYGPKFAEEFYQYLLKEKGSEGLDSTRAAYALHYATRKVREILGDDDNAFLTWVPYVHFGY